MHKFDPSQRARLIGKERQEELKPEKLLSQAGLKEGDVFADIGCGPGFFSIPAALIVGDAGRVYSIDTEKVMLSELARQKPPSNILLLESEELYLPLMDSEADFALLAFVLHEIQSMPIFLDEVKRILKSNGKLLLLEWEKQIEEKGPPFEARISREDTARMLQKAGFKDISVSPLTGSYYSVLCSNDPARSNAHGSKMEKRINGAVLSLKRGDITEESTQAIVNAANSRLSGGGGVDGAIHRAGGPAIMDECRKIGGCETGNAVITTGGRLKAKYVIHTVGPVYRNGRHNEAGLLRNAYFNSLELAKEKGIKTIAFPSISTGAYNYPTHEAAEIAIETVVDYMQKEKCFDLVRFVLFSDRDLELYKLALMKELEGKGG